MSGDWVSVIGASDILANARPCSIEIQSTKSEIDRCLFSSFALRSSYFDFIHPCEIADALAGIFYPPRKRYESQRRIARRRPGAFDDALGQGAAGAGDHAIPPGTAETQLRVGQGHRDFLRDLARLPQAPFSRPLCHGVRLGP